MLATILLIWIPSASALALGAFTAWLCAKLPRHWLRLPAAAVAIFLTLVSGAWGGLILSCAINRFVFDWKVLEAVLPSGIYLWYGFGPGLTPQFAEYWIYVSVAKLLAWPLLTFAVWRLGPKIPKPPLQPRPREQAP